MQKNGGSVRIVPAWKAFLLYLRAAMIQQLQLRLLPEQAYQFPVLRDVVAQEIGVTSEAITDLRVRRRSIDARQRRVMVNLSVDVYVGEPAPAVDFEPVAYPCVEGREEVVVVGAGPGGLFAALRLIELGLRPIVVERGKDVHERKRDLARISREHMVDPESNYSFGEGGAGAYSDGKLFTRSKKRGSTEKVLRVFCQHGASKDILVDAHPHIGTDRLPAVIEHMREQIRRCGGEVYFQTKVTALKPEAKGFTVVAETPQGEHAFRAGAVILATGHSARDVYRYLYDNDVAMEQKGIAVGVRLEHPSELIDRIQYHSREGRGRFLPAAEYSYVEQVEGHGVYSFCMCPGGVVVPAASGPGQVVVNGMSPASRGGRWSNSGMVVEVRPQDLSMMTELTGLSDYATPALHPLAMLAFQEALEHIAWLQGGRRQTAPAQRMADFVNGRLSADLPASSYTPGLLASPLHFWMPRPIAMRLQEGFRRFGRKSHGFLTNEATVIGLETRTSAPLRIVRDAATLCSPSLPGLFPCGEGAGYAGGIVSAAIDGERCAEAAARHLSL